MNRATVPNLCACNASLASCLHPPPWAEKTCTLRREGKRTHRSGRCDAVAAAQVQLSQYGEACHGVQSEAGAPRRFQAGEVDARDANLAGPQGMWSAEVASGKSGAGC